VLDRIEPLFPCYFFAHLRLGEAHYRLTHTPGVIGLVCIGGEPCAVDASIIETIKSREKNGLIVFNKERLRPRQRVTITEGALRGIEAVFERYLSGIERVAVLLDTIGRGDIKAILRAEAVTPTKCRNAG
jgi:transcription antitermination factor NusG